MVGRSVKRDGTENNGKRVRYVRSCMRRGHASWNDHIETPKKKIPRKGTGLAEAVGYVYRNASGDPLIDVEGKCGGLA